VSTSGRTISASGTVRTRVTELVAGPAPLLVVSDFDGTLAPITIEPMATRIVPGARAALRRLARLAAARPERLLVAVLSGRAALDVAGRVRVGGLAYHGNHGLESGVLARGDRAERLRVGVDTTLEPFIERAAALGVDVARRLGDPAWLLVEEKGPSVAFHFRQAPDAEGARASILEAIEEAEEEIGDHGLVRFEGRKVIEFRPLGAGGKGAAVEGLIDRDRPGSVIVLGDDRSDAEAFRAVVAAREAGVIDGLTVAIHGAAETPAEVVAAADILLPDPAAAARVLALVARLLEREGPVRPAAPRPDDRS
jgi:trehalose 6-phosphate phosphatase